MALFTSKKTLRNIIRDLEVKIEALEDINRSLQEDLDSFNDNFPLDIGEVVYDVQLRNDKGRYTKKNASREHSLINDVIVTEKNYFNLVNRYHDGDVYLTYTAAEQHMNEVCVD